MFYSYVPIWVCALVITTCSIASVRCIKELFDSEKNPQYKMSYKTKSLIIRILIIPICFIILRIPGSFAKVYGIMNQNYAPSTGYAANAASAGVSTLAGFINFIVYVLLDSDSRKAWRQFFDNHHLNCMCFGSSSEDEVDEQGRQVSRDSSFAGPLSVYGLGDEDLLSMSSEAGMNLSMVEKPPSMGLSMSSSRTQSMQYRQRAQESVYNENEKKHRIEVEDKTKSVTDHEAHTSRQPEIVVETKTDTFISSSSSSSTSSNSSNISSSNNNNNNSGEVGSTTSELHLRKENAV